MTEIVLAILAGLVLFLFAIGNLSEILQDTLGKNARQWILRFTSGTWSAIATGTVLTMLLDSSSAVIIITIILVNAGTLQFRQTMGIVLGANIGTTLSSQIIAMDIGKYSPVLLVLGFILLILSRSEQVTATGKILLNFGVLFFGLFTMENAVEPLRNAPFISEWLQQTSHPVYGAMVGAITTLIIQSSSATVGMTIILAKKGMIDLAGGLAIMIGAELGTVSDTLLATIKGSREAVKTALFHLLFSLTTLVLGLLLFDPFVRSIRWISSHAPIERAIANGHVLFNVFGVLLFVWFIPHLERMLNALVPNKTGNSPSSPTIPMN